MIAPHSPNGRSVLDVLEAIARDAPGDRIRLSDIVAGLGDRAFGLLMLIFSLPNAVGIGTIPGVSTIFGVPQIFLAVQMAIGLRRPWIPRFLLDKTLARSDYRLMLDKAGPHIRRVERVLHPRWHFMTSYLAERLLGVAFLVLAAIVSLPIPLGNQPPAVAMALISLGVIERDGAFVAGGLAAGVLSVALAAAVVAVGATAIWLLVRSVFGL